MIAWYVARIDPAHLYRATRELQGTAEVYCPLLRAVRRVRGKIYAADRPLLLDYVFLSAEASSGAWKTIRSTRGVMEILTGAGEPVNGIPWPCPAEIVETIRAHEAAGEYDLAKRYFEDEMRRRLRKKEMRARKFRLSDLPEVARLLSETAA